MGSIIWPDQWTFCWIPRHPDSSWGSVFIWTPERHPKKNTNKLRRYSPRLLGLAVFLPMCRLASKPLGSLQGVEFERSPIGPATFGCGHRRWASWGYPLGELPGKGWNVKSGWNQPLPLVLCFFNSTLEGKLKMMGFQKLFACVGCWSWWWRRWGLNH